MRIFKNTLPRAVIGRNPELEWKKSELEYYTNLLISHTACITDAQINIPTFLKNVTESVKKKDLACHKSLLSKVESYRTPETGLGRDEIGL
jgi:hypothetical protein